MKRKDGEGNPLTGSFVRHHLEMRRSPAWEALSENDKRILERIEREHMEHGGRHNGRLVVTYDQFETYGVRRKSINKGIHRLEALGFVEAKRFGYDNKTGVRIKSEYRLTYADSVHDNGPQGYFPAPKVTNDWQRLNTPEKVQRAIEAAAKKMVDAKRSTKAPKKKSPAVTCEVDDEADFAPAHRTRVGGA